jgi:arginyl-tRNA synthetase
MVQKSDGGFGYAATDLAALRYRVNELKCDRIVYVTDVGQEFHFKQVFEGGEKCGFVDQKVTKLDHMMFGMVLQENTSVDEEGNETKKAEKIKTREGKSVKLYELLDEAKERALKTFEERAKAKAEGAEVEVRSDDLIHAAEVLGISSIKYYDLKQNRTQNYVFSFDQMLDAKGNTGVYLIYAYARICSILRKAEFDEDTANLEEYVFTSTNKSQRDLALTILRLPEAVEDAAKSLMINRLTDQLYEIATRIGDFYHNTKVIGSDNQKSSIALLLATKRSMETCFDLLGMKTLDKI